MVEEGLHGRVHVRMCAVGREQFTLMFSKAEVVKAVQFSSGLEEGKAGQ